MTTCRCCRRSVPVMPRKRYTPVAHVNDEGKPCWLAAMYVWTSNQVALDDSSWGLE